MSEDKCIGVDLTHVDGNCAYCTKKYFEAFPLMKIFKMSDAVDWYVAPDLESAITAYLKDTEMSREEYLEEESPRELTMAEMHKLHFYDEDDGTTPTFIEELRKRLKENPGLEAGVFASTEF